MTFQTANVFVTLAHPAIAPLVDFYTQLFEKPPAVYRPDIYAEFDLPGLRLGIFTPRVDQEAEFASSGQGGMSLCLEVADLEEAIARLTYLGYPPPGMILTSSHGREVYAYDPAGYRLILHEPDNAGFHRRDAE